MRTVFEVIYCVSYVWVPVFGSICDCVFFFSLLGGGIMKEKLIWFDPSTF